MLSLYLIVAIAAVVWGAVFILRGSLVAGCLVYVVVASCFGYEFLHFSLGPVPLTLDRIVLALLIVAYGVQRRLGRTDPKPLQRTDALLLGLLGVLVLSGCHGGWGGQQTGQAGPLFRLIAGYLVPFLIYWIVRQSPLDRARLSLVHGTLACLGVYLAVTGVLEITGQWWAVFPKHIADPGIGLHFGRARGPMVHSVSFGLHLGICLLAAWLWRWRLGRAGQLLIIALLPLMLAGIYGSYTRSVWMGVALALLLVLGLSLRGAWRPLVLGGMISAGLLLVVMRMDSLVSFQREYAAEYTKQSAEMRGSFAYISWKMFLDRPLLGVGFGQFPQAKLPYLADRSTSLHLEATRPYIHHNTFLSILAETGLVGFVLYVGLLAAWGRTAWTLARDLQAPDWARAQGLLLLGSLGVYVCQAAFHELSYMPMDNSLVFFLAGLTMGLRPAPGCARATSVALSPRRWLCVRPFGAAGDSVMKP